jgi:hypothetical protein
MKKLTIAAQIQEARDLLQAEDYDNHNAALAWLQERKLNKVQKAEVGQMIAEFEELGIEATPYNMGNHIARYRERYSRSVAASGAKSLNNGDDLAGYLEMKTAKEVCSLADEFTPIKGGQTHYARYERLNEGQRRMNSGNKLRAAIKQGKIEVTEDGIRAV